MFNSMLLWPINHEGSGVVVMNIQHAEELHNSLLQLVPKAHSVRKRLYDENRADVADWKLKQKNRSLWQKFKDSFALVYEQTPDTKAEMARCINKHIEKIMQTSMALSYTNMAEEIHVPGDFLFSYSYLALQFNNHDTKTGPDSPQE